MDVSFATADGTATSPADFAALPLSTITFAPGQLARTVTVTVAGDLLDEFDESFTLNLSSSVNATISDGLGLGTITDNDALPILSVDDVTVTEGDAGTVNALHGQHQHRQRARPLGRLRDGQRLRDRAGRLRVRRRPAGLRRR